MGPQEPEFLLIATAGELLVARRHRRPQLFEEILVLLAPGRAGHVQAHVETFGAVSTDGQIPVAHRIEQAVDRPAAHHLGRRPAPADISEVARRRGQLGGVFDQLKAVGRARGAGKIEGLLHGVIIGAGLKKLTPSTALTSR